MHTSSDIQSIEPTEIIKGSTVKWNKTLEHYKADDGWALTYAIRGGSVLDITATASGSDHSIILSTAQTTALLAGNYWWQSYATKGSERFDVASGQINVKSNLAFQQSGSYDGRSHVKKTLDAIEATLEGRATTADSEIVINGRSAKYWGAPDLLVFRDRYKSEYIREVRAEKIKIGMNSGANIHVRFTNA